MSPFGQSNFPEMPAPFLSSGMYCHLNKSIFLLLQGQVGWHEQEWEKVLGYETPF
jgi:hypothetical protein